MNTSIELLQIKKLLYITRKKSNNCLRDKVLARRMLKDLYIKYPITFALSIYPNLTHEQIKDIVTKNPNAIREIQLYNVSL